MHAAGGIPMILTRWRWLRQRLRMSFDVKDTEWRLYVPVVGYPMMRRWRNGVMQMRLLTEKEVEEYKRRAPW